MKKIGLGVIGINPTNMGSTTSLLAGVPTLNYELRAVCAKRADVLAKYAQELGVSYWTTDYRELVQRQDVDVVAVYSPDHLHAEHCLAAVEANKHVICTKPMVTNLDDAKQLVTAVKEKGVKFLVGQTMRFDLQFLALQRMFEDGEHASGVRLYPLATRSATGSDVWRRRAPGRYSALFFRRCRGGSRLRQ